MSKPTADRRTVLGILASTGATAGLAGCLSDGGTGDDEDNDENGSNPQGTGFETLWEKELPPESVEPTTYRTAIGSGFLAVAVEDTLYGIDTENESVEWEASETGDIDRLAVTDTHVFVHHAARTGPGTVYPIERANGEKDGQSQGGTGSLPMLALADYVITPHQYHSLEDGLYAMGSDGSRHGSLIEQEGVNWVAGEGNYAVVGRRATNGSAEILGYDLDLETGPEQIWSISDLDLHTTGVVGGTLVAPNGDAFTLIDIETGDRTDVSVDADIGNSGQVVTAEGKAFYTAYGVETLYAIDPGAEEVAWTVEEDMSDYSQMASTGDAIVLRRAGNFRAVDPASSETLAEGGDPPAEAVTFEAHGGAVYSCEATITAHDADFSA
ncbi:outer membrane protein assembly factor BamB family protein [Halostella pelagica]|uniref:outer membrane protein assembly factor BamB family protein n=1 Tax=Halostella pelagica TaxID=2583824 RepID=UPI00108060C6|nr:PQQ-binding-like beta-propeller repeat protein [Halostella pelagica]